VDENSNVYFTSQDDHCYSFTPDGQLRWKYDIDVDTLSDSPTQHENRGSVLVVEGGDIYFGAGNGNIYCLSKDGVLRWIYPLKNSVHATPIMDANGNLYIGEDQHCKVLCLDPDRKLLWTASTVCMEIGPPALGTDGTIYVTSMHGFLTATAAGGKALWRYKAEGKIFAGPAVDNESNVYIGACDGFFYKLGPDGKMVWRYKTTNDIRSSAIIARDGTIYVACEDGYLYAFKGRSAPASSACPMFNRDQAHTGLYRLASTALPAK